MLRLEVQAALLAVGGVWPQVRKFVSSYGGALVEEFITGREFTVLVAENGADSTQPIVFEPVECQFTNGEEFKHFELKWIDYESMQ